MPRARVALAGGALVACACLAVQTTFSAFSSAAQNPANSFAAGTVYVGDNDGGGTTLTLTNAGPGSSDGGCVLVTYSGSLDASLRLYATLTGAIAPYLTLTVTRGADASPSFDSCGSFTADSTDYLGAGPGVIYSGLLSAFPTTYDTGIVDPPSGTVETWTTNEAHSYKFAISLGSDLAAQGLSGTASFTWEARNL